MPIYLESRTYTPENVTGTTDHLKGNILQKIVFEAKVRVETFVKASTAQEILFLDPSYQTSDYITDINGSRFEFFNVGDSIEVVGSTSNNATFTIIEKVNDSTIRVGTTLTSETSSGCTLRLDQEPKSISYDFGLIENNEATNFNSKVSNDLQRYVYSVTSGSIGTSYVDMVAIGNKSWQTTKGACQVKSGTHDTTLKQYFFFIKHTLFILPPYLENQFNLLEVINGNENIPPSYFNLFNCLKHAFQVNAYKTFNDPNIYQSIIVDTINGDTGWFNENYNGLTPQYTLKTLNYNSGIETIASNVDTVVSVNFDELGAAANYCDINFYILPESLFMQGDPSKYLDENYLWDRARATVGGGAVNGSAYGTDLQVIKSATLTTSASVASLTFTIDFGVDALAAIAAMTDKRFILAAAIEGASQTAQSSNYTTVLIDVNQIKVAFETTSVTTTNYLFTHEINEFDADDVAVNDFFTSEDELVGYTTVEIDTATQNITLEKAKMQVVAVTDNFETVLEEIEFNLRSEPLINGQRFINKTIPTPFNVASTEFRANYRAFSNVTIDTATVFNYSFAFPFLLRWEYWEQLILSTLPPALLDTSEQFDGYNHNWNRIGNLTDYELVYRFVGTYYNGSDYVDIKEDTPIPIKSYDENADWENETIKLYEGATELVSSGTSYYNVGNYAKVEATFEWVGAGTPDYRAYYMVIRIIDKETGGHVINNSFSSEFDRENVSYLTSDSDAATAGLGKIILSQAGNVVTGYCYIDPAKFAASTSELTISARIAPRTIAPEPVDSANRVFQDDNNMLWQDGNNATFQG